MLAHHGNELYVGPRLHTMLEGASSLISRLVPTLGEAALMFSMNLATWREDEFIREAYAGREIDDLEARLLRLAESNARGEIAWKLRQIAIEHA